MGEMRKNKKKGPGEKAVDQNSVLDEGVSPYTQRWLDYLDGRLSAEEREQLEREVEDSEFLTEAMEGLREQSVRRAHLAGIVHHLNHDLHRHLDARKRKRLRDGTQHQQWIWIVAILLVLAICFAISYYIAKKY